MNVQNKEEQEEDDTEAVLNFISDNFRPLYNNDRINLMFSQDNLSFNYLSTLINGYPYLPFSGGSLRPFCLNHIINDIVINGRKQIIEFGSGISTIVIARLIKKNRLNASIISVEHDLEWSKKLFQILSQENLQDVVNICYAPLKECSIALENNEWYDTTVIESIIENKLFDMVIVDGPTAWTKDKFKSRYPALPFMINKLHQNHSIYLDDANREGERNIISLWEKEFAINFIYTGSSLAYFYNGVSFFTEPYAYY